MAVLASCGQSKDPVQKSQNNISELYEMNEKQNCFDLYFFEYLKQKMNVADIENNINKIFEKRNILTDDDEKNYWDLCVIEGIRQKVDTISIINIVSNII